MKNLNQEQLEEINLLFELIKTMFITWLSQTKIKQFLKEYTHTEIRNWKFEENWNFIVNHLVTID